MSLTQSRNGGLTANFMNIKNHENLEYCAKPVESVHEAFW
jgi:hypothetical protein